MIENATIQRVMDATDIVDVVKEFVTLRKAGANYKGLCPFHNERTPSFNVSPARQIFKCFSCGKGGNAVKFLMELEQMTYPEAIKWLARKYGIEVEEREQSDQDKERQSQRESLFIINDWAKNFFQNILHNDVDGVAKGLGYFRSRGFRDDIIRKFQLGYAPAQRNAFSEAALKHGFKKELLEEVGLCFSAEEGGNLIDRYRERVIFPILSVSGRVVAFGGRILGANKDIAKYINSPESLIYDKSRELYGLYQAKSAIVKQGRCFLVEGYTDVISMHQSGVENVVASSGTSLTTKQIQLLHRFTNNVTVLYDGDAAGIKASLRGIDMLLDEGLNIKVLLLPDGDDPDSFARKHRAEEFQQYIERNQVDFIKFKINLLFKDASDDPIKRAELVTDIVRSISHIHNEVLRNEYVRECAVMMKVGEDLIINELNKIYINDRRSNDKESARKSGSIVEGADPVPSPDVADNIVSIDNEVKEEKMLISMIIRYGEQLIDTRKKEERAIMDGDEQGQAVITYISDELQADKVSFSTPLYQQIFEEAKAHYEADENWKALPYFSHHINPLISALAADVTQDDFVLSSRHKQQYVEDQFRLDEMVPRLIHDLKHSIINKKIKSLLKKLQDSSIANDPHKAHELMAEFMSLSDVERTFAQLLGDRVILS